MDILDATSEKEGCIQFSMLTHKFLGAEDCLFNNIHIPKIPQKNEALRPVIVNIHPGAYRFGSPHTNFYGSPEFIMHNDVVYVCISYRLHILGYLNLNLKECSGNQAIKDIILSLQWIKNNIRSFGGDPDNITLLGSSSGSTLTQILLLSPSTQGKAVLMGGHLTNPVIPHQKTNETHAREIAKTLGYDGNVLDNEKVLMFLREQEPLSLIEGFRRCEKNLHQTNPVLLACYGPYITTLFHAAENRD
ncbi:juvenile hormone esterase-like [Planococcus citri]|uniref:juvenile hormone esterase-like n=1 Tax=Planococcus citri TaxID=170843 RepID=UPI0031F81870